MTKNEVVLWLRKKFPPGFESISSLVTKVSIQLPSTNENAKKCACAPCNSIRGWREVKNFGTELYCAHGSGRWLNYFIHPDVPK